MYGHTLSAEAFGIKGDLLELGSAGGFFLEAARRRGWNVSGVEKVVKVFKYLD